MESIGTRESRSYETITKAHLTRLGEIAEADREMFFRRRPDYRRRVVAVVLAQGAALHYLDQKRGLEGPARDGVKDLDLWTFFAAIPGDEFPFRRKTRADFGPSSLGRGRYNSRGLSEWKRRRVETWRRYEGRPVDLMVRSLPVSPRADPVKAVQAWLRKGSIKGRRSSAWWLSQKAVVMIDPEPLRGRIIWPESRSR